MVCLGVDDTLQYLAECGGVSVILYFHRIAC